MNLPRASIRGRGVRRGLSALLSIALVATLQSPSLGRTGANAPMKLSIAPLGVAPDVLKAAARSAMSSFAVRQALAGARHRLISVRTFDDASGAGASRPDRFDAMVVDYTNRRTLRIVGEVGIPSTPKLLPSTRRPLPNREEYLDAVRIVRSDVRFAEALASGGLVAYRSMPPLVRTAVPGQRVLSVGLRPTTEALRHEIVGVDMTLRSVVRYASGAPPGSLADEDFCGSLPADQDTSYQGEAGQSVVTVTEGSEVVWRLVVVRPSASSGINGSGVELRFVDHRGTRLLDRAHVPILNVRYEGDTCGPYRDWTWEEGRFNATGDLPAPGFSRCTEAPSTIEETGDDRGTFRGVAIYLDGRNLRLVSELEAEWYRYTSEWTLSPDGRILPRFRLGAVANSCVCNVHTHHVYWRFDFNVGGLNRNSFDQFDDPAVGGAGWRQTYGEARAKKDPASARMWRVRNASGGAVRILPGAGDGVADPWGVGDIWSLRYSPDELDDGEEFSDEVEGAKAHLDKFLNNASIDQEHIVVWYAAHLLHDVNDQSPSRHEAGPDLIPEGS